MRLTEGDALSEWRRNSLGGGVDVFDVFVARRVAATRVASDVHLRSLLKPRPSKRAWDARDPIVNTDRLASVSCTTRVPTWWNGRGTHVHDVDMIQRAKEMVLFVPPAACAWLCSWQVRRAHEKQEQIEEAWNAVHAKPKHLHDLQPSEERASKHDMTRVAFDAVKEGTPLMVQPRMRGQKRGCLVVQKVKVLPEPNADPNETPHNPNTHALWIRGWAPLQWCENEGSASESKDGDETVHVDGVKRTSETPSRFALENNPGANAWHWIDKEAMNEHLGISHDAPLVEQMSVQEEKKKSWEEEQEDFAREQWPKPRGLTELIRFPVMPDGHRQYALTWAALGLATGAMAVRARKLKWTKNW